MTISEIRDAFILKAKREAFKRQIMFPTVGNTEVAMMVAEAEQDLQNRLLIVESSASVPITNGVGSLPLNCGKIKLVKASNGDWLQEKSAEDVLQMQANGSSSGASVFARQTTGGTESLLVYPLGETSVTVYFWVETLFYQPSSSTQYFGSETNPYASGAFSGNLLLPAKYSKAIQYHMLAEYFDDYMIKYEQEVNKLKGAFVRTLSMPKYQFGGLEEDGDYESARQNASIQTSGGSVYDKHIKIFTTEGSSSFSETLKDGFGSIGKSLSGNTLTITSSGEFIQGKTIVDCSTSFNWAWDSASQIRIIFPFAGWTSATVEIHVDS